jgi:O-glycosyl hydrolase
MAANTAKAEETLTEAGSIKEEAEADYLDMEYESAQERMEEALVLVSEAMDEATAAKDRALLWIYVSQWMATTAAAMVSGVVLWWLMVKRKLYREVKTTQLGSA